MPAVGGVQNNSVGSAAPQTQDFNNQQNKVRTEFNRVRTEISQAQQATKQTVQKNAEVSTRANRAIQKNEKVNRANREKLKARVQQELKAAQQKSAERTEQNRKMVGEKIQQATEETLKNALAASFAGGAVDYAV